MIPAEELSKLEKYEKKKDEATEGKSEEKGERKGRAGREDPVEYMERQKAVANVLNSIISAQDLRKLKALDTSSVSPEARAIFENPNATDEEVQRFNRLIVEQVFETSVLPGSATSIAILLPRNENMVVKVAIEKERLVYFIQSQPLSTS